MIGVARSLAAARAQPGCLGWLASDGAVQSQKPTTVVGWRGQGSADTQSDRVDQLVVRGGLKGLDMCGYE